MIYSLVHVMRPLHYYAYCYMFFIDHAFYLPCLVLYVLTHMFISPPRRWLSRSTSSLWLDRVDRHSSGESSLVRGHRLFMLIWFYSYFDWVWGELWTCLMPPQVRGILDSVQIIDWVMLIESFGLFSTFGDFLLYEFTSAFISYSFMIVPYVC